jgi:hypothetical protein
MRRRRLVVRSSVVTIDPAPALVPEDLAAPLLGSAGNATADELALAARFDGLHQLLYDRPTPPSRKSASYSCCACG